MNRVEKEIRKVKKKINTLQEACGIVNNKTVRVILWEKTKAYKECFDSLNAIKEKMEK